MPVAWHTAIASRKFAGKAWAEYRGIGIVPGDPGSASEIFLVPNSD
jgi:hypothetical protein